MTQTWDQKSTCFQMRGAVIVATEDEAGTHRATAAGGSVTINFDYLLLSRDLVDVVNRPTIVDEFSIIAT